MQKFAKREISSTKKTRKKAVKMESTMLDKRIQTKITTVIVTAHIGDHWSHLLEKTTTNFETNSIGKE